MCRLSLRKKFPSGWKQKQSVDFQWIDNEEEPIIFKNGKSKDIFDMDPENIHIYRRVDRSWKVQSKNTKQWM